MLEYRVLLMVGVLILGSISCHEPTEIVTPKQGEDEVVQPDIDVQWISRTPKLEFIAGASDPTRAGWPAEGDLVTWHARIQVWGGSTFDNAQYEWRINQIVVSSGEVVLPGDTTLYFDLPWTWEFERNEVEFRIKNESTTEEGISSNNSVTIYTNALSVGFAVKREVYDYFRETQQTFNSSSNSFEDWSQFQLREWNRLFREAVYPETPEGVLDRVRLDTVIIYDDFSTVTNKDLKTIDLLYFFTKKGEYTSLEYYQGNSPFSSSVDNPNYYDGVLFHEVGHVRYLVDIYNYNVRHDPLNGDTIAIYKNGQLLSETDYFPSNDPSGNYVTPMRGLMNFDYDFIDQFSAIALNRKTGMRALFTNTVAAPSFEHGDTFTVIPDRNTFVFKDKHGLPIGGAEIKFYYDHSEEYYKHSYAEDHYFQSFTDENGMTTLPEELRNHFRSYPFFNYGWDGPHYKENTLLIRIKRNGKVEYRAFEGFHFILAYWQDNNNGQYEINLNW